MVRWLLLLSLLSCGQRAGSSFTVSSGLCTASGQCVRSPSFPRAYPDGASCNISLDTEGFVTDTTFVTEMSHDTLSIRRRGRVYSGRRRSKEQVDSVYMPAGSLISWTSDSVQSSIGWELCVTLEADHSRRRTNAGIHIALNDESAADDHYNDTDCGGCLLVNGLAQNECNVYYGSCPYFEQEHTVCWITGSRCYAPDAGHCCEEDDVKVTVLVGGLLLGSVGIILIACFCISSCPGYRICHDAAEEEASPIVAAGVPMSANSQHMHRGYIQQPILGALQPQLGDAASNLRNILHPPMPVGDAATFGGNLAMQQQDIHIGIPMSDESPVVPPPYSAHPETMIELPPVTKSV